MNEVKILAGNRRNQASNPTNTTPPVGPARQEVRPTLRLAQIAAFSALIAIGTILTNALLGIVLPPPLTVITVAPAFYMAISVLYPRKVSIWSTLIGSAVGESFNILIFGTAPASIALSFVPGIAAARVPETVIIARLRQRSTQWTAFGMVLATVYETLAFFIIDWPIYSFTAFYAPFYCSGGQCGPAGLTAGFYLALFDFGTLIDVVWIPVALAIVQSVRRAFNVQFFD